MKRCGWIGPVLVLVLAACSPGRETVVVYSPHGPEMLKAAAKRFEAANPGVQVQWFDMGSQEVFSKVNAEKANPRGDVWWGAPSTMFIEAAKEGLLQPYKPSWASAIPTDEHDPHDLWYAMYRSPLCILFNNRHYTKAQVPQTWDDLLKPKWKGKITLRNPPPSGTMRVFIGAMILRQPSESAGIAWLKKFAASVESYQASPQLFYDHIKRNPQLISVWLMPDAVMQRQLNGYPFGFVVPPDTPVTTDGIAIIKGAPHPNLAKKFYEFVSTPKMLAFEAREFAKMPARKDLDPKTLPAWLVNEKIQPMKIDWAYFAKHEQHWMDLWQREVRGAQ